MAAYYRFIRRNTDADGVSVAEYEPLLPAQGAWNAHEQHMAPATGVMCAELEAFMPRADLRIGRVGLDILGLIPLQPFSISTKVLRPGKTIELIEATMVANGRACIVARAWRMQTSDTRAIAGMEDRDMGRPEDLPDWTGMQQWAGGFIESMRFKADAERRAGKGVVWLNNDLEMVEGQATSSFVHVMGMVDTANGIVPRAKPDEWAFPNLDLHIDLLRLPQGQWLGLDTCQQYGSDGIGLTSSVLHDEIGVFGRSEQILTLRPMGK